MKTVKESATLTEYCEAESRVEKSCGGEKFIIYLHYSTVIRIWAKNGGARACQRSVKNLQAQTL